MNHKHTGSKAGTNTGATENFGPDLLLQKKLVFLDQYALCLPYNSNTEQYCLQSFVKLVYHTWWRIKSGALSLKEFDMLTSTGIEEATA